MVFNVGGRGRGSFSRCILLGILQGRLGGMCHTVWIGCMIWGICMGRLSDTVLDLV